MSGRDRWCTKADILKDLAEVNGRIGDVDERYILTGKKPPPAWSLDMEDNELKARFGYNLCDVDNEGTAPDLNGISEMLRMVKDYDNNDDDDEVVLQPSDHVVISKLNPEVAEFVPGASTDVPNRLSTNAPEFIPKSNEDIPREAPNRFATNVSECVPSGAAVDVPNDISYGLSTKVSEFVPKGSPSKTTKSKLTSQNKLKLTRRIPELVRSDADLILKKKLITNDDDVIVNTALSISHEIDSDIMTDLNKRKESNDTKNENSTPNISSVKKESYCGKDLKNKDQKCDSGFKIEKRIDISQLNPEEIQDMTVKLRSQISDACKKENLRTKRENNVAIATLLKLYSATPRQSNSPMPENSDSDYDNKPLTLFTPEYFETHRAASSLVKNKTICELHGVVVDNESDNDDNFSKDSLETSNVSKNDPLETTKPTLLSTSSGSSKKLDVRSPTKKINDGNLDVQNSINKVNNWFEEPKLAKPNKPAVCLGPIAFKRKTPAVKSPVTPVSDMTDKSSRSTPTSTTNPSTKHYKPSEYAQNLSKKFMEQGKALEKQQLDIWQRAELLMKEKEESRKKKLLEKSLSDQESNADTGAEDS